MKKVIRTSEGVAEAANLARVDVVSTYPITPQTIIVETLAQMKADGEFKGEYIPVESEHSAMSACIGASATGVRSFTATAAQGLALMYEMMWIASGMRLPITMVVANRAMSAPLSIWDDHSDSIGVRDSGWIQLYVENGQEALDTTLQAFKIAENENVLLPAMVCIDGFILSHVYEPIDVPSQKYVDAFLPPYKPKHAWLDPEKPITQGAYAFPEFFTEFRKAQWDAMENAKKVIKKVNEEYLESIGRGYGNGLVETLNLENADICLVTMGSLAGTIRHLIDTNGYKEVGLVKLKSFRPFPREELRKIFNGFEVIAVLEKDVSIGFGGALYNEIKASMYDYSNKSEILSFILGLGGRDVTLDDIKQVIRNCKDAQKSGSYKSMDWVGLKNE